MTERLSRSRSTHGIPTTAEDFGLGIAVAATDMHSAGMSQMTLENGVAIAAPHLIFQTHTDLTELGVYV